MNTIRFALIRLWIVLLRALSTTKADPADIYFCYRLLLDREPDGGGWRHQLKFIENGRGRNTLVESFLNSSEYQSSRGRSSFTPVETGRFTMWVDAEDTMVAPSIMAAKSYETHVTAVLERELNPECVFVDIGANMGWFTLLAASLARQVIAIEPNPNNVQLIYRSLMANGFDHVRVLEYAATDRPSLLRLNFLRSNGSVSAVESTGGTSTIVQGRPLDDLLKDVARVDVVKMDIEGHEPVALRGMIDTLTRHRPVLVFEFHPTAIRDNTGTEPVAFLESLAGMGYQLAVIRLDGAEIGPLEPAGVLSEWENINREMKMDGTMHLDLIGRPL